MHIKDSGSAHKKQESPMAQEFHSDKSRIILLQCAIIFILVIGGISSCTPVNDVQADRTSTVIDSISIDSLNRRNLLIQPRILAFETEFPSNEIVKNIDFENISDSLMIPIQSMRLKHGNRGFSLLSDSIQFTLSHKGFAGFSKSIPIRFNAPHEGKFDDTLIINDWKNIFIPLTAIVNSGTVVWIEDMDFGSIPFGEVRDTIIRIHNYGNEKMVITDIAFIDGDQSAYQVLQPLNLPITLDAGNSIGIPIRSNSDTQKGVKATIRATIAYSGKGRVKHTAECQANVYLKNGIYVTDISLYHAKSGKVNEAMCTIVNNTSSACTITAQRAFADNLSCNVLLYGNVYALRLDPGKKSAPITLKITPKSKGSFAIEFPFTIIGDSVIDDVCSIHGMAD
jgi:hypothetical protein